MQLYASNKNKKMIKKQTSLFDQKDNGSKSIIAQEQRAQALQAQLKNTSDQNERQNIENELFEIEKYCHTVNFLLCGGV